MLREVEERFKPVDDESDMGILFETTGFQVGKDDTSWRFWEDYCDFEELGSTNLVRADKNEELGAHGSSKNVDKKKVNLD